MPISEIYSDYKNLTADDFLVVVYKKSASSDPKTFNLVDEHNQYNLGAGCQITKSYDPETGIIKASVYGTAGTSEGAKVTSKQPAKKLYLCPKASDMIVYNSNNPIM